MRHGSTETLRLFPFQEFDYFLAISYTNLRKTSFNTSTRLKMLEKNRVDVPEHRCTRTLAVDEISREVQVSDLLRMALAP
jgi:hypothetical protein